MINSFIEKANKIHNNKYDYSKCEYVDCNTKVNIYCNNHLDFFQMRPSDHIQGQCCPVCSQNRYSKKQMEWLNIKKVIDNTNIQHKLNKGEYLIDLKLNNNDRTKSVDGYSKNLNKVYEFQGDYWHGNPKKYNGKDINKTCKKTFGDLYDNTIIRITTLRNLGYIVEEMWEYDWDLRKKLLKQIKTFKK